MAKNKWRPSKGQFGAFGGNAKSKAGGGGFMGAMSGGGNTWKPSKGQWGMFGNAKGSKARGRGGKGGMFGKKKVQELQGGLNSNGADPQLKVDGEYGPKTAGAVNSYNQNNQAPEAPQAPEEEIQQTF